MKFQRFQVLDLHVQGRGRTGAVGAFAPVNFMQQVHAPILKRLVEFFNNTKLRKSLVQITKLQKLRLITLTL